MMLKGSLKIQRICCLYIVWSSSLLIRLVLSLGDSRRLDPVCHLLVHSLEGAHAPSDVISRRHILRLDRAVAHCLGPVAASVLA